MLAASQEKMSGSEKKVKKNMYNISSINIIESFALKRWLNLHNLLSYPSPFN